MHRKDFTDLKKNFQGEIKTDNLYRLLFSTDASAYKETPEAVCFPKTDEDIRQVILFAIKHKISLIPRAAGTSLAGQVVGRGIVVDISKYQNKIIEFNQEQKWVRVQAGVNLDELNLFLKPYGLFFGPETSTASRCKIGGMLGNNSCGARSLVYGSMRDKTISVKAYLSNASFVEFNALSKSEFNQKYTLNSLEGKIYSHIKEILSKPKNQEEIRNNYPKPSIHRRNNAYALDQLLETSVFTQSKEKFNFCKLIAGSEGTLAFVTEIKLQLDPLPEKEVGVLAAHFNTLEQAFEANLIALKHQPRAVELMDKPIMNCTLENAEATQNSFFIKGEPEAILMIELRANDIKKLQKQFDSLITDFKSQNIGFHFPVIYGKNTAKVWNLRKAGLGLLSNISGDLRPVTVIEDTAVTPEDLPAYIHDFQGVLDKYGLNCVYYGHIGSGELHLRPMLNLKDSEHVKLFRRILKEIAILVKKYRGSLSGEHGDGRLRGEFIPFMLDDTVYELTQELKQIWDAQAIFNPGKIVNTPPMDSQLRYSPQQNQYQLKTILNFDKAGGIIRATEKCNGSGDCLKSYTLGGTMCPSYQATRDEKNVTRARANALREYLSYSTKENPFDQQELYEVLDLCLMCKACKSECPSSVDITKLKAEFLQHYYDANGVPFRSWLIANITKFNTLGQLIAPISNFFMSKKWIRKNIFARIGFAPQRELPKLRSKTLKQIAKHIIDKDNKKSNKKKLVYLFADEFTNFNDSDIGIATIRLLTKLGYEVRIPKHYESGRTYISKGLIRKAQKIANKNIKYLSEIVSSENMLVGIEPSAILSFRDEYPDLAYPENIEKAKKLAKNALMIDEFLASEMHAGNIKRSDFNNKSQHIKLHGHCQQKAVASTKDSLYILSFPTNYTAEEIPSGCCGMAGAFGYEKEHYELSMKIGEMVLFPAVRQTPEDVIIAANGTSCRHQIKDGTQREALHPVMILWQAIKKG